MNPATRPSTFSARAKIGLTLLGLLFACAVDAWAFRTWLDRSYLQWYCNAGPFIALATAAFGAAWGGLDRNPALIAANPLAYVGACLQVTGLPLIAMGAHLRKPNRLTPIGMDLLPVLVLALSLSLAMFAWLALIVPAQYFVFLVAGAPSRAALTSRAQISARIQSGQVEIAEGPLADRPGPEGGWWDASMRNKPITLASAYGAALLFVLGLLLR